MTIIIIIIRRRRTQKNKFSHVESMKAVKCSVYSAAAGLLLRAYLEFQQESALSHSDGDLLLITEPSFTDKMHMTIAAFA